MDKLSRICKVLKGDARVVSNEGHILKNKVQELAYRTDGHLLKILLNDEMTKELFFSEIDNIYVFDKLKFAWVIGSKDFLPDSYTAFANKIMLSDENGNSITKARDVVLSFPCKDCIVEMDSTSEKDERNEVLYNEILMKSEIDTLLAPKVFAKAKKYCKDGIKDIYDIRENDNLIVKGNNLLVLYSLLPRYKGKIKLMYWDVLYNTDDDKVPYNDSFKHSSWLTMMKNRLEVAKKLLGEDGCMCIQINDDEKDYLKVLMDEIFDRKNYIATISIRTKSPSGFQSVNPGVFKTAEYIMVYSKNKSKWNYNQLYSETEYDKNYKWYVPNKESDYSNWNIVDLRSYVAKINGCDTIKNAQDKFGAIVFDKMLAEFALKNASSVFQSTAIGNNAGKEIRELRDVSKKNASVVYELKRDKHYDVYVYNGREMAFYSKKTKEINGKVVPSMQITNIWNDIAYEGISPEGNVTLKKGKKPERLLKRIIEMCTNPGDLVLDAYLGSGTTAAVAHKLNRKYIGIEQLDTHVDMALNRLQNVISGDERGISKIVKWIGGGEFIYLELASNSQKYIDRISSSSDENTLLELYTTIKNLDFISYRVDINSIESNKDSFMNLSLEEKKKFLISIIDKNTLYVNYCDIDDECYSIQSETKELNNNFYTRD